MTESGIVHGIDMSRHFCDSFTYKSSVMAHQVDFNDPSSRCVIICLVIIIARCLLPQSSVSAQEA